MNIKYCDSELHLSQSLSLSDTIRITNSVLMKYLLVIIVFCLGNSLSSQISTGSITYNMKMDDTEGQMEQITALFQDMNMQISFNPEVSVVDMTMLGMIQMKTITQGNKSTQYMDIMGQKIKVVTNQDDLKDVLGVENQEEFSQKVNELYKLTPVLGDTKEVLGYNCTRTDITMDIERFIQDSEELENLPAEMKDMKITAYVTEEIQMSSLDFMMVKNLKFKGAPLLMTVDMGIMTFTIRATDFNKDVDPSIFQAPEGEYQEMSPQDLEGLGLGGFGF